MDPVLLVVLIVGGVGLVQAVVWIPLVRWMRRRSSEVGAILQSEVLHSGERTLLGPVSGVYRGGTGAFGKVKGNGTILLTDRRLVFRKLTGGAVEVPTASITGTCRAAWFLRSRTGGATHLVVATADGEEVGFYVPDVDAWEAALADIIRR